MNPKEIQYCYGSNAPSPFTTATEGDDDYDGIDVNNEFKYDYNKNGDSEQSIHTTQQLDSNSEGDEEGGEELDDIDAQGISLLSEIFPDASREELEDLHFQRVQTVTKSDPSIFTEQEVHGVVMSRDERNDQLNENLNIPSKEEKEIDAFDLDGGDDSDSIIKMNDTSSTCCSNESNILNSIGGSYELNPNSKLSSESELSTPLKSPLGKRILRQCPYPMNERNNTLRNCLSDDFLRIPSQPPPTTTTTTTATTTTTTTTIKQQSHKENTYSRNRSQHTETINWEAISRLERNVTAAVLGNSFPGSRHSYAIKTVVLQRDMYVGLGLRLREWKECIYVDALLCQNGIEIKSMETYHKVLSNHIKSKNSDTSTLGPAFNAGINPADRILGVNGEAFLARSTMDVKKTIKNWQSIPSSSKRVLSEAVKIISEASADSIAVHVMRFKGGEKFINEIKSPFHGDLNTPVKVIQSNKGLGLGLGGSSSNPKPVHSLAICLSKSGIVKTGNIFKTSKELDLYTKRASMWSSNEYLRDLIIDRENSEKNRRRDVSIAFGEKPEMEHFNLDLSIVRQGLCVHIVNAFVDEDRLAFTIWVYDVESQKEWYAPVRYFQDFRDLRLAISRLHKNVEKISFPNPRWFHESEASSSQSFQEARCYELELFLRELCTMIYKDDLKNSSISEIALYIQTFLGCDANIDFVMSDYMNKQKQTVQKTQSKTERDLKCAVQLHSYRIFLLTPTNALITNFIGGVKKRVLSFQRKKTVSKTSDSTEKETILSELFRIRHFYSSLTKLIHDGCDKDFKLISEYYKSRMNISSVTDTDKIIQDSVREQVEIHAYVPLRSILSKLLVFGWRYDDKEFFFKQQVLQKKDQSFFKIKSHYQSPSNWQSVINILNRDVGQSTLPCVKLHAIVSAGKEIYRLSSVEFPEAKPLGADDFLPIFIYCVVRAEIEKPYALSVLLRNLCNEDRLLGEIGYYLSSFEAAIAYIHESDLSSMNQ